jgi:hypothetical protein
MLSLNRNSPFGCFVKRRVYGSSWLAQKQKTCIVSRSIASDACRINSSAVWILRALSGLFAIRSTPLRLECPAFFEPVALIETVIQGANDGTTEEAYG